MTQHEYNDGQDIDRDTAAADEEGAQATMDLCGDEHMTDVEKRKSLLRGDGT